MSRFLIFGAMAWDRHVRLNKPLSSGVRLTGMIDCDPHGAIAGGRLGGGGANSAAALLSAGHKSAIYAPVPNDVVGDDMVAAAQAMGADLRFINRVEATKGSTLILIEPDGERIVLGLQPHAEDLMSVWKKARATMTPPSLEAMRDFAPDGIYLRAPLPGFERTAQLDGAVIVAHWPFGRAEDATEIDVLIGSKDDLANQSAPDKVFESAQNIAGTRLKHVIVTEGAKGGVIYGPDWSQPFDIQPVEQVDSTGAGDCFAAGVLEALTAGANIYDAVAHGAVWGAATASLLGAAERRPPGLYTPWAR